MTVLIERDAARRRWWAGQNSGAGHEHADPQEAGNDRDEQPIAGVGDQIGLAPPRTAGIARPKPGWLRPASDVWISAGASVKYRACALIRNESQRLSALQRKRFGVAAIAILTASQCLVVRFPAIHMDWDNSRWVELRQYVWDLKEPFS